MEELILKDMQAMAQDGFRCSQIIMKLGLKRQEKKNPDLVRAMGGLVVGIGYSGKVCGALTAGACLLSYFAGKGEGGEEEHPQLWDSIEEFVEWFDSDVGQKEGVIDCRKILEREGATSPRPEICGPIVLKTHMKVLSILEALGL